MPFAWPDHVPRIPDEEWVEQPLGGLALHYDTVERHGWYRNLDRSIEQIDAFLDGNDLLLDYSGGTGILADRLIRRSGERPYGIVIADSSPKFLRLALEKFRDEERVALRRIRYRKEEARLERLDEVLDPPLLERGVDAIASTNAIHLYYDLDDTLASWRRVVRPSARVFAQSGNIGNPDCGEDEWIIDDTVEAIHHAAVGIVRNEPGFADYRDALEDEEYMAAHDALRVKYFLPVRPLEHYLTAFEEAGFEVVAVERETIEAEVDQWFGFLRVYLEGVVGWVGGAEKVTGEKPPPRVVADRERLMRMAMERVFGGSDTFRACWTYLVCEPE